MIELSEHNNCMKDFHDLYTLLYNNTIDGVLLEKVIHATLKNRGTIYEWKIIPYSVMISQ